MSLSSRGCLLWVLATAALFACQSKSTNSTAATGSTSAQSALHDPLRPPANDNQRYAVRSAEPHASLAPPQPSSFDSHAAIPPPQLALAEAIPGDQSQLVGPMISDGAVANDARNDQAFAARLFGAMRATSPQNLAISPASVRTALGMIYVGARGRTAKEMSRVLMASPDIGRATGILSDTLREWSAGPGALRIANRAWAQRDHRFLRGFLEPLNSSFSAPLATLDFARDPEGSRSFINAWVDSRTEHHVRELIPIGVLDSTTKLVVTNAVYFAADWATAFDPSRTSEATFHARSGDRSARFMHLTHEFAFAELGHAKALRLPYANGRWSMLLLLPNELDGLARLEETLDARLIQKLAALDSRVSIAVSLPRFGFGFAARLDEPLSRLGMSSAFAKDADFSGMDGTRQLFLSAVLHQATITVDERGTIASAATAAIVARPSAPAQPKAQPFRADHPFLCLICDRQGRVLFIARVAEPTE